MSIHKVKTSPNGCFLAYLIGAGLSAGIIAAIQAEQITIERKQWGKREREEQRMQGDEITAQHSHLMSYHCNHHICFSIPISFLHLSTLTRSSGLVSRSAAMSVVGMKRGLRVPLTTSSQSQKNHKLRCFIQLWCSGFLATEMADWLSI